MGRPDVVCSVPHITVGRCRNHSDCAAGGVMPLGLTRQKLTDWIAAARECH